MSRLSVWLPLALLWVTSVSLGSPPSAAGQTAARQLEDGPVGEALTRAQATDGRYISWREHIIDDEEVGGVQIRGGDGLAMADLDLDGYLDIVSVHESDTEYDGVADGHIRLAFGSASPTHWDLATLVEGPEAGAAEDVALADVNGDGYPDVIAACELAHLIYLQNPGPDARTTRWERLIPPVASGRGSYIRAFFADFDGDGRPEVVAANKGAQSPDPRTAEPSPISWFEIAGDPLEASSWTEHELTRVNIPINSEPVDLDGDGDLDIVGGSRGEGRIMWFENRSDSQIHFVEHSIRIDWAPTAASLGAREAAMAEPPRVTGFNLDFADLDADGQLDIVISAGDRLVWLEQPAESEGTWLAHYIGSTAPDSATGFVIVDIDGDSDVDVISGGYSRGPRDEDGSVTAEDPLGRLAWFENPGNSTAWIRHDISRRKRGMFDKFLARDMDSDGDVDFVATRGNSASWDGVFWLEQVRSAEPRASFERARAVDSEEMPLPRSPSTSSARVVVTETAGIRRTRFPARARIQWSVGQLQNTDAIRLIEGGEVAPAQATVLSRWSDRSVNQLALDFNVSIGPYETRELHVEFEPVMAEPAADRRGLSVIEDDESIQVGRIRFSKAGSPLIESIAYREELIVPGTNGLVVVDRSGGRHGPSDITWNQVEVLKEGPLSVHVRYLGRLQLSGGDGVALVLDVEMPNSKSWVKISATVSDPGTRVREIALETPLDFGAYPWTWDFGTRNGTYGAIRDSNASVIFTHRMDGAGRGSWDVRTGPIGAEQPYEASPRDGQEMARHWAHLQGATEAVAFAIDGLTEGPGTYTAELNGEGRTSFGFAPSRPMSEHTLIVYAHYVSTPVPIGAATSPASILSPLEVRIELP